MTKSLVISLFVFPFAIPLSLSGQGQTATIPEVPGFELRQLDQKLPITVNLDGKQEQHFAPIWVHMPKRGEPISDVDLYTDPVDLNAGTSVLPPPPDGFGLRTVKQRYQESFLMSNGQIAIVEVPVFIYFPHVLAGVKSIHIDPSGASLSASQEHRSTEQFKRETDMFREMKALESQISESLNLIPAGAAKDRLRDLTGRLASLRARNDSSIVYNVDGSVADRDIR